jgi:single-strand DNA-binding protein
MNELEIDAAGTVTKDPELTFTPQGKAVTRFRIAVNSSYRNDKADWVQRPTVFLDCVVWNEQAERLAGACNTGDRVIISDQLADASFEAKQGERAGQMIRRQEVLVDEVAASFRFASLQVTRIRRKKAEAALSLPLPLLSRASPALER